MACKQPTKHCCSCKLENTILRYSQTLNISHIITTGSTAGVCTGLGGRRHMHNKLRCWRPTVVLSMWTEPLMTEVRVKSLDKANGCELVWNERLNNVLRQSIPAAESMSRRWSISQLIMSNTWIMMSPGILKSLCVVQNFFIQYCHICINVIHMAIYALQGPVHNCHCPYLQYSIQLFYFCCPANCMIRKITVVITVLVAQ